MAQKLKTNTSVIDVVNELRLLQGRDNTSYAQYETLIMLFSVLKNISQSVFILDKDGNINWMNQSSEKMTGYTSNELGNKNITVLKSKFSETVMFQIRNDTIKKESWMGECISRNVEGNIYLQQIEIFKVSDARGSLDKYVVIVSDADSWRKITSNSEYRIGVDTLTGLPDTEFFRSKTEQLISHGSHFYFVLIDFSNFSNVNLLYSYDVGDTVLISIAERLKKMVLKNEAICRLNDDVFALLIDVDQEAENIVTRINQIQTKIKDNYEVNGIRIDLDARIGLCNYPEDGRSYIELLQNTQISLKQAKGNANDSIVFYSIKGNEILKSYLHLGHEILKGIKFNEFEMHYQPLFDTSNLKVMGAESLIRWHHPVRGLIMPRDFIPFAEQSELIVKLGYWSIERVMKDLVLMKEGNEDFECISINLSAKQFKDEQFIQTMGELLEKYECSAESFILEITEQTVMDDLEESRLIIKRLQRKGFRIALDDFGVGQSSLSVMSQLPIDILKIDPSLITEAYSHPKLSKLTPAVFSLAKSLNILTLAEGVESLKDVEFLTACNAEYMQGYYFDKPISRTEFFNKWVKIKEVKD